MRRIATLIVPLVLASTPLAAQELASTPTESALRTHAHYFVGKEDRLEIAVHIWGEVARPGIYRVPDDTDLVGLISVAGGPTANADLRDVKVTRPESAVGERLVELNLMRWLETRDSAALPPLRPGDTVRIARTSSHRWGDALRTLSTIAVIASTSVYIGERLR